MKNNMIKEIIDTKTQIRKVLDILNEFENRVCVALDKFGRVERTITDGDIRRALINNCKLTDPISVIPFTKPITCNTNDDFEKILGIMNKYDVLVVIKVNNKFEPLELIHRDKIQKKNYYFSPHIGNEEEKRIHEVFSSNWIAPVGPQLEEFENKLAKFSSRKYGLAVSSGTAVLHLALRVLDIKRDDLVYVSDLTFVATVNPILYLGAKPVFIDCNPKTWNISVDSLKGN